MVWANHISGVHNQLSDALSCHNHVQFLWIYLQAAPQPSAVSLALLDLLITSKLDWLTQNWTNLWKTIFRQHYLPPHSKPTPLLKTAICVFVLHCPCHHYQFQNTNFANLWLTWRMWQSHAPQLRATFQPYGTSRLLPDPNIANMPKLEGVMNGIKSLQAKSQPNECTRLPITPAIMLHICKLWEQHSADQNLLCYGQRWPYLVMEVTVPSDSALRGRKCGQHLKLPDPESLPQDVKKQILPKRGGHCSRTDPEQIMPGHSNVGLLSNPRAKPGFLFQYRLLTKSFLWRQFVRLYHALA